MRNIIYILLMLPIGLWGQSVYYVQDVADNANASDSNAGTDIDYPWATPQKAFATADKFDTVYFRSSTWYPGSYASGSYVYYIDPTGVSGYGVVGNTGREDSLIHYLAYPGESPVFDMSNIVATTNYSNGIGLNGVNFTVFDGIEICNLLQQGTGARGDTISINGIAHYLCSNVTFRNTKVHHIGGRGYWANSVVGLDLSVYGLPDVVADTFVFQNCDTWNCMDTLNRLPTDAGNHADGWKTDSEHGGVFKFLSCRTWLNSDDGWDPSGSGLVIYDSCWAVNNGHLANGNGNGIRMGGVRDSVDASLNAVMTHCISVNNIRGIADTDYYPYYRTNARIYNCFIHGNDYALSGSNYTGNENKAWLLTRFRNCIILDENVNIGSYGAGISLDSMYIGDSITWEFVAGSEWNFNRTDISFSEDDFVSLDADELIQARKADGSLPDIDFGKLETTSVFVDRGMQIPAEDSVWFTLDYNGDAPDMGWAESGGSSSTPITYKTPFTNSKPVFRGGKMLFKNED